MIYEFSIETMAIALYRSSCQEQKVEPLAWVSVPEETQAPFKDKAVNVIAHYCRAYDELIRPVPMQVRFPDGNVVEGVGYSQGDFRKR